MCLNVCVFTPTTDNAVNWLTYPICCAVTFLIGNEYMAH